MSTKAAMHYIGNQRNLDFFKILNAIIEEYHANNQISTKDKARPIVSKIRIFTKKIFLNYQT